MDGTPFGRYRLVELLGRGGMGEVWRAHDTVTDRIVAIKLLPPQLALDDTFVQRFRREAHAAAGLNSPHVVPIHDYGEIDGQLFVSMRLIEGRDLQQVLAGGPLEPGRAVRIVEQVAKALHAAHKVGLVHRDVKPSNILLDEDDFAYLIDFGIARGADQTKLTSTGAMIGTWAYMAPERMSAREVDARADIYALACVLYESLTGSPPFPGDSVESQIAAHLTAPPPRPSSSRPELSEQFDPVIEKGMAKNPDERYATTVELSRDAHDAITTPIPRPTPSAAPDPPTEQAAPTDSNMVTDRAPSESESTELAPSSDPSVAATAHADWTNQPPRQMAPSGRIPPSQPAPARPDVDGTPPAPPLWRRPRNAIIAAVIVILAAAGITAYLVTRPSPHGTTPTNATNPTSQTRAPPQTTPPPPPPVAPDALDGLLLSPDQINTAMGATGMTVSDNSTVMSEDYAPHISDKDCIAIWGSAEAPVYAGTGWTAVRDQGLHQPGNTYTHSLDQTLVLFPSAHDASAFFTASTQSWLACSNRQFTYTQAGQPDSLYTVGPVSNTNGTLSVTFAGPNQPNHLPGQHALTVANNVVIEVLAYSHNLADSAVTIAHQIAAKVPT